MTAPPPESSFVPGLDLAEAFYREAVAPLLERHEPDLVYTAALIGPGSEVLGFDTAMSTDHHWGPRVQLFLRPEDLEPRRERIRVRLAHELPASFRGFPTSFTEPDTEDRGTQRLQPVASGPIRHRVEIETPAGFFRRYLHLDLEGEIDAVDWLTLPHQKLRSIRAGRVFRDDLQFGVVRERFRWYPRDIWIYVLASSWARIGEDEHLMGRAGSVGDELGSSLIASRLVRELMRLAFLIEREYPPYAKWWGTAFRLLSCAPELAPPLESVTEAGIWKEREAALCSAYRILAAMHNRLEVTRPLPTEPSPFWGRPFRVIHGERFAEALRATIGDPQVRRIAARRLIGSIDQFSDSTDLLEDASRRPELRELYRPGPPS
jgi:hypothetical protein